MEFDDSVIWEIGNLGDSEILEFAEMQTLQIFEILSLRFRDSGLRASVDMDINNVGNY